MTYALSTSDIITPVAEPERVSPSSEPAKVAFADNRQRLVSDELAKIVVRGGFISLLTFAIYRFWMKTQQRQLVWRETRVDGDGFEYTGTALELLIGTMIAVVILAVWFGIANLGLSFLQIAAWQNFELSFLVAPLVFAPLIAFAVYRARRYRMLRTKWRGIRFGMDGSALRYTGLWLWWTFLQIVTLGFLTPHKRMALERRMTSHMLYGDARFRFEPEEGALRHLLAHWMLPWLTGIAILGLFLYPYFFIEEFRQGFNSGLTDLETQAEASGEDPFLLKIQVFVGLAILAMMLIYPFYLRYKSREIAAILSSRRLLGARCESRLTWGVTAKPVLASLGYGLLLSIPIYLGIAFLIFITTGLALVIDGKDLSHFAEGASAGLLDSLGAKIVFFGGLYITYGCLIVFGMWLGAVVYFRRLHTFICRGTTVHGLDSLDVVHQRIGDDQIESEGFADALDIGGI